MHRRGQAGGGHDRAVCAALAVQLLACLLASFCIKSIYVACAPAAFLTAAC